KMNESGEFMRPSLAFKTLLRTPVKTIITFLLIAAASFALFSRVTDYAVTSREMRNVVSNYRGVVALNNNIPDTNSVYYQSEVILGGFYGWYNLERPPTPLSREQIETISNLPGVTLAETRYMTGGVINEYERFYRYGDLSFGYNYNTRFIIEGTLSYIFLEKPLEEDPNQWCYLTFVNCNVIAGKYPLEEASDSGHTFFVMFKVNDTGSGCIYESEDPDLVFFNNSPFDTEFVNNLELDVSYTFAGTYSELIPTLTRLGDQETYEHFNFERTEDVKTNAELSSRLQDLIDITEKDFNVFDIVYSSDMQAIPRVNEQKMVLHEGRFLTAEDAENNAQVCVVGHTFFTKNNLSIGDKLTIGLGDRLFMQHAGLGALTYTPERMWNVAQTVEFEIVGVYMDTESPYERAALLYWTYHPCTVFVPMSFLPVEIPADHEVWAGEFSVLIENPEDITAFFAAAPIVTDWISTLSWDYIIEDYLTGKDTRKTGDKLVAAKWRYSDRGWSLVKDSVNASGKTSLVTTAAFIAAAALALLLSVYLYIGRGKKTYAIMRALGVPKRKAGNALAFPFFTLSFLAVLIGGISGLIYTSQTIAPTLENLSDISEHYTANITIPTEIITLCLFSAIGFILLLTLLFLFKTRKTPPLELLQGDIVKIKAGTVQELENLRTYISFTPITSTLPQKGKYSAPRHISAYILRHIKRVKRKTAISLMLAVTLTGAVGFLVITKLFYNDLFNETDVNCTTANFSTLATNELFNSELVENIYYTSDFVVFLNDTNLAYYMTLTNDFERCMLDLGGDYVIEYADGYENADFFTSNNPLTDDNNLCIIGADFGVKPGETITLLGGDYTKEREAVSYEVAAVIYKENPADKRDICERIYTPLSANVVHTNSNEHFIIDYSEFFLTDNEKSVELLSLLNGLKEESQLFSVAAEYNANTLQLDNIKRVRDLLILLFPAAVTAAVLIGLTAPGLLILQSSKEAAILRVLGTTKKRVRCMLMFEQIALCTVGIAFAAVGLMLYNSSLFTRSTETLAVCGVLYLLGCICAVLAASISVTKRKILYLLQVKE
ncbi:MAG: hypothetical protein FWG44_07835, partial [Oscillospiraceae bacterium]|nr:hypothetical protein [Oscillospiraceae bacterium]